MKFRKNFSAGKTCVLLALIAGFALFTSCNEDDAGLPSSTADYILAAEGYALGSGTLVKVWAQDSLFAGYNPLFIELLDSVSKETVSDASVTFMPIMDMSTMQHACPFENPALPYAVDGLFPGAVIFQMPGDMGWTLKVMIDNLENGLMGSATFPLAVRNPALTRCRVNTALNDGSKLVLTYVLPTEPKVGINDFEMTIHKRVNMMEFPADGSYTVSMEPEMPSMGHESPNNVDPVHTGNGHYAGKVNFTMTGEWRINLRLTQGAEVADSTLYFDVLLN